ncbi:MAG: FtsW/RodA/SpoVE family cell cycle protein [Fimbriimonadaceae bacterium]
MKNKVRIADPLLFWLLMLATFIGLFFIFDAGYPREIANGRGVIPSDLRNQLIALPLAVLGSWFASKVNPDAWLKWAKVIWIIAFISLFLPHVPGIAFPQNGAYRWFKLPGLPPLQPAEFAKLAAVLYLSAVFATRKPYAWKPGKDLLDRLDRNFVPYTKRLIPIFWVALAAVIIEREPDMGTAFILGVAAFAVCIAGGASRKALIFGTASVLLLGIAFTMSQPYRMARITNHVHRWDSENIDSTGYQTVQSELGFAEGGFIGVGPGNGRAKHVLPAATTDFVMATVGEEFGILGSLSVLGLIGFIVFRMLELAGKATTRFGSIFITGVAAWIGLQATLNIMMSNGLLPAIGVPMPFISYGGSSLAALWLSLGICNSALCAVPQEGTNRATRRNGWRNRRTRLSRA